MGEGRVGDLGLDFDGTAADGADVQAGREQVWSELKFGRNHPLKTAGLTGYVCTPGASPAGIPSRRG